MDGVFLIHKPVGWTSFDVCAKLRKKFQTKKVGHSGTLDPFAEGLMIVALGNATKILPFLEQNDKTYVATLKFGEATDTLDLTGKVVLRKEIPAIAEEDVDRLFSSLSGKRAQVPPMYSALKKNGTPLYELAREGKTVERKAREIEIYSLERRSMDLPYLTFETRVSKGTYIRSLGEEIAESLSSCGHLVALKRISIGTFLLEEAHTIESVMTEDALTIEAALSFMDCKIVDGVEEKMIRNGMKLRLEEKSPLLLLNGNGEVLAVYEKKEDGFFHCKRGLWR